MTEQLNLKPMRKSGKNPLGINVLLCPICLKFSFFQMSRTNAVKHFWRCYAEHNSDNVSQEKN